MLVSFARLKSKRLALSQRITKDEERRRHDGVTVLLFFREHCTLTTTLEMGKICSNHLHFLSYLLKCPVDNAGNGKEFGACPQTVIPLTSNRVRTSNFFPLPTYFKVLSYAPERDLSEIILTKTKKTAHTDGYICITEEIFFHFGFTIQVVLFKSKSPFCN